MKPNNDLKKVKPIYLESLSLVRMKANQEFDLSKITK
jgi:hypothetical protein